MPQPCAWHWHRHMGRGCWCGAGLLLQDCRQGFAGRGFAGKGLQAGVCRQRFTGRVSRAGDTVLENEPHH